MIRGTVNWRSRLLIGLLAIIVTACSTNRYAGVDLRQGRADRELRALALAAQRGDKRAQLALGIRYEKGLGIAQDRGRAEALYRAAANSSGGIQWIYVPPVGKTRGHVSPVNYGPRVSGLEEAAARLAQLRSERLVTATTTSNIVE